MATPTETAPVVTETPTLFTRKATGLVREGRTRDALFNNIMWSSVALTFAIFWLLVGSYSGGSAIVGILIATALGLPGAFLYAMLTQIMPRSGGTTSSTAASCIPRSGSPRTSATACGQSPPAASTPRSSPARLRRLFAHDGRLHRRDRLAELRRMVFHTLGPVHHGHGDAAVLVALFVIGGTRLFFRVQVWCFALYALGAILLPIVIGVLQSRAGFIHNFNAYAAHLGTPHASSALVASAAKAGFKPAHFDLLTSIRTTSVFWFVFGFIYPSTYYAGEIRMGKGTHMKSMPGAVLLTVLAPPASHLFITRHNVSTNLRSRSQFHTPNHHH